MSIVVTGSIAYDYLMSFPGKFTEHLLPEHVQRVSLSFLVDSMDKRRGGCAPNIAYTLALLGERPRLMGTAGQDFGDYRRWLDAAGVDTSLVAEVPGKFTASFFCSTDIDNNQIASFYTGAMANAAELSFRTAGDVRLTIISPNDPAAMTQYAEECRTLEIPFIFDPGQQCARMSGEALLDGLRGAAVLIVNDYELELLKQKTGLDEEALIAHTGILVVTQGRARLVADDRERPHRRGRRDAASHRRSDRCRRRLPRRPDEGDGGRPGSADLGPAGQRRGHLRARASWRHEPRVHRGRVRGPVRGALRAARAATHELPN